jgi:hypothetical protein
MSPSSKTPWSWALLERSRFVWTLDSFPTFYGTRRFNTEFTRALHLFLSWARQMQSTIQPLSSAVYNSEKCIIYVFDGVQTFLQSHQVSVAFESVTNNSRKRLNTEVGNLRSCGSTYLEVEICIIVLRAQRRKLRDPYRRPEHKSRD